MLARAKFSMRVVFGRSKGAYIEIDETVFSSLLSVPTVQDLKGYKDAVSTKKISLRKLQKLARDAEVPYPLFFAPASVVKIQIDQVNKEVIAKLPTKPEMGLAVRGKFNYESIKLIATDLARKQLFLRKLQPHPISLKRNKFIGLLAKMYRRGYPLEDIAAEARRMLGIDIKKKVRKKSEMFEYLIERAESCGILVSVSAYDYMPQNLDRNLGVSGFCMKDLYFPFVFINTRDGDEEPLVFESEGRKVFTLVSMLAAVLVGKFALGTGKPSKKTQPDILNIYKIAGMILIPDDDVRLPPHGVTSLDEVKQVANVFKVTPSMALQRLYELKLVSLQNQKDWKAELRSCLPKKQKGRRLDPIQGYKRYNGVYFSGEVVRAYKQSVINQHQLKGALFKHGRADAQTVRSFVASF